MTHHLTLIPSTQPVTPVHLAKLREYCGDIVVAPIDTGLTIAEPVTIDRMKKLRDLFADDRMDIFCTPVRDKPYQLLLADMDATMVAGETLDDIAARAVIGDEIAAITTRAMNGELNFEDALRERVGLLKNRPARLVDETLAATKITKGAQEWVASLKDQGCLCVLVSGGFTFFTQNVADRLGFDHHHGNILHINGDQIAGTIGEPILDKDAKRQFLYDYARRLGIDLQDTIAIGDGANDLPMLSAAGLGIGYRPKSLLEDTLLNCLRYADLSALAFVGRCA